MTNLARITAEGSGLSTDTASDGTTVDVVDLYDPNGLTGVVGHLKFAFDPRSTIVFRGQATLHSGMVPSAFRGRSARRRAEQSKRIGTYVSAVFGGICPCKVNGGLPTCNPYWPCQQTMQAGRRDSPIVGSTPRVSVEPLLQHYGLGTRWLDVVDNVWVALWFACHRLVTKAGRYAHHARRSTSQEPNGYAYIKVMSVGELRSTPVPGVFVSDRAKLTDLRYAAPSIYLRPHAQHGVVIASHTWSEHADPDLSRLELATLRIRLGDALEWLGEGAMLSPYVLFPPASRDEGFRRLLDYAPTPPGALGQFLIYGPGS